jgi:hypothetical protein
MEWKLFSSRLSDGAEVLTLKRDGRTVCEYAPALYPYQGWHAYYNGFPKAEFSTREACIKDAERVSGGPLAVVSEGPAPRRTE